MVYSISMVAGSSFTESLFHMFIIGVRIENHFRDFDEAVTVMIFVVGISFTDIFASKTVALNGRQSKILYHMDR